MAFKSYSEKLKDPRWQKVRLKVFERDNFRCCLCHDMESTLTVHHYKYRGEPWDAPMEDLVTLCELCHKAVELCKGVSDFKLQKIAKIGAMDSNEVTLLVCEGSNNKMLFFDVNEFGRVDYVNSISIPTLQQILKNWANNPEKEK